MKRIFLVAALPMLFAFLATGCGRQKLKAADGNGPPKPQAVAPKDGTPKNVAMPGTRS